MKIVIFAGGFGTRLGSITETIPKPMIKIGNKPILWHIMKYYASYGYKDFVLALGYKAEDIKSFFYNYNASVNDFTIDLGTKDVTVYNTHSEKDWKVTLIDTGINTLKGARLKRLEPYLDETNFLTYGDGLSDVKIDKLLDFHKNDDKLLSITGVRPPSRFGEIQVKDSHLQIFQEKSQASVGMINGGFMVFEKKILDYLSIEEDSDFEVGAFDRLIRDNQIRVFEHNGLWECVDTQRDLNHLNKLWDNGEAFWKNW